MNLIASPFCRSATALASLAVLVLETAQPARAQSEERAPQAETNALASLPYTFLERFCQSAFGSLYTIAYDAANPFCLSGDFDGDGQLDYALKLRAKTNKDVEEDVVFFAKGEPRLISRDIKEDYPGPARYVVAKKERPGLRGDAMVKHYGGSGMRWTAHWIFNYLKADKTWRLVRSEQETFSSLPARCAFL